MESWGFPSDHTRPANIDRDLQSRRRATMGTPAKDAFDVQVFLSKVEPGNTALEFYKGQYIFEQGDVADRVFYIQTGRVKLTVMSEQGKEAIVAILEPGQF